MLHLKYLALSVALLLPVSVMAENIATVKGLQMPAWVERDSARIALKPGMRLQSGDQVNTGEDSRLVLGMSEGSDVKLGENATLTLKGQNNTPDGFDFSGVLSILKGAFRFTTSAIGERRTRNVDINIGAITAGIRGTDVWGKSYGDKDLFALISGKVEVTSLGVSAFAMRDPATAYIVPTGGEPQPLVTVPSEALGIYAEETELQKGQGVLLAGEGKYSVVLMSFRDNTKAQRALAQLNNAGYAGDVEPGYVDGQTWYRVQIPGFVSYTDAVSFTRYVNDQMGITGAWLRRI